MCHEEAAAWEEPAQEETSPHCRDGADNTGTEPAALQEVVRFCSRARALERRSAENGGISGIVYVPGWVWRVKAVVTQNSRSVPTRG